MKSIAKMIVVFLAALATQGCLEANQEELPAGDFDLNVEMIPLAPLASEYIHYPTSFSIQVVDGKATVTSYDPRCNGSVESFDDAAAKLVFYCNLDGFEDGEFSLATQDKWVTSAGEGKFYSNGQNFALAVTRQ